MNVMKKLKDSRKNKKGFTLVELIVVLVILAILMAILIPALTGYIRKAQDKQVVAEGRTALMAAQTALSEEYEKKAAGANFVEKNVTDEITELTDGDLDGFYSAVVDPATYKVKTLSYSNGKKTAVYNSEASGTGDDKVEKGWTVQNASTITANSVTLETTTP